MESNRAVLCLRLTLSDPDGAEALSVHFIGLQYNHKRCRVCLLNSMLKQIHLFVVAHAHHDLFVVTAVTALSL